VILAAEDIFAAGGANALRLATRGAVKQHQRDGTMVDLVTDVAVPIVRLANRLRDNGDKGTANSILEHAVHDGIPSSILAEAIQIATSDDHLEEFAPPVVQVGPRGELRVGPPAEAHDLASAIQLTNYIRDRLLTF
jgi:hypothetical protein